MEEKKIKWSNLINYLNCSTVRGRERETLHVINNVLSHCVIVRCEHSYRAAHETRREDTFLFLIDLC